MSGGNGSVEGAAKGVRVEMEGDKVRRGMEGGWVSGSREKRCRAAGVRVARA